MKNNLQGLLRMNLQLLAEDTGAGNGGENPPEENKPESKTYTDEELQKLIQSESDKRVTQAMESSRAKWEKEYQEKLEKEKSEAEKLAKMTADERAKAQFEKEKEKFESERAKFQRDQLELETVKELGKQGLDVEFSSFLMGENAESTNENIKLFKEKFDSAVEKAVTERLKGKTPKTTDKNTTISVDKLKGMSIDEINANWDSIKGMKL
ncbi:DUF4355 domain-containing protein [Peptostreptococcus sp. D1]|uniref:DUF4355 domain-containing protein n=1 Tax=Peptostreptococcus sp. D1 TaxID=72304 RepID=UPI0008F3D001|nr:DUF4355 domain-containing protein [Peptostreptococcus sp. D1]SFE38330.1 protein of unknown function [Peptostreptococcus sp. D1]